MADADAPAASIGGRYRLDRQLATGGMGSVWLGWDTSLRREVAVKRLHLRPGLTADERRQAVERAMREGRITARLHHPHAVPVYDVVDDEHGPCLIMQYVPSRSLAAVVEQDGPLPPEDVARIGTQVAAALAAAHRVGIVHRDVKPANILIAEDGTARITDFGVSHAMDDVAITSTGMVTGTPGFLAPEVARGEASTFASDVYSLGATLYLAVEGETPFGAGPNPMALLHRVASGRPRPAQRAGSLTPMLQRMMAPAPADRPGMVELAGQLPDLHPLAQDSSADTEIIGRPDESDTRELPRIGPGSATLPHHMPRPARVPVPPVVPAVEPVREFAPTEPTEPRRHRALLPVVAALLVVALGVVLAVALLRGGNDGSDGKVVAGPSDTAQPRPASTTPSRPATTQPQRTASNPPATADAPEPTQPTQPTEQTEPKASKSHGNPHQASAGELTGAVVSYFQLIPGDLDAAWDRLTPGFQQGRAGGRESFDQYWQSVSRVDVNGASSPGPGQASATLVYHYRDGRVVTQQTTFRFQRQDGELKIASQN